MDFIALINELKNANIDFLENEPMSRHTSFRIGGPAAVMVEPKTAAQFRAALLAAEREEIPVLVMGNGSNMLVSDEPIDMMVVKTFDSFSAIEVRDECIYAQSGALLSRIAVAAQQNGLTGFEFAHGIPGTLGGAVFMNAGAYGGEIKDVVAETDYLTPEYEQRKLTGAEHDFGYRHSAFSAGAGIVLGSLIKLSRGNSADILARMQELSEKRRKSQPLEMPSAGSTFKRPQNGYAAALIDGAGLKGFSIGGAQVSEKHAGFVVNKGGATFNEVLRLMQAVKLRVYETSGIELEPEVRIIRGRESR